MSRAKTNSRRSASGLAIEHKGVVATSPARVDLQLWSRPASSDAPHPSSSAGRLPSVLRNGVAGAGPRGAGPSGAVGSLKTGIEGRQVRTPNESPSSARVCIQLSNGPSPPIRWHTRISPWPQGVAQPPRKATSKQHSRSGHDARAPPAVWARHRNARRVERARRPNGRVAGTAVAAVSPETQHHRRNQSRASAPRPHGPRSSVAPRGPGSTPSRHSKNAMSSYSGGLPLTRRACVPGSSPID